MTENIDRTNSGLFGVKLQQSPKIPASRLSFPGFHSPFSCVMSCSAVSVWGKLTSATNLDNLSTKIWCSEPAMACCCCCSSYSTSRSKDNTTLPQRHYSNVFFFFLVSNTTCIQRSPLVTLNNIWCIFWIMKWEDPIMNGLHLCGKWITYGILRPWGVLRSPWFVRLMA